MAHSKFRVYLDLTRHAKTRQQQRGISRLALDAALDHGRILHLGTGVRAYYLGEKELTRLKRRSPKLAKALWRFARTTVLISNETGALVTTYRCKHPSFLRRSWR